MIVHSTSPYLIIVLLLLLYIKVFLRVQFLVLCFFSMHIKPFFAIIDSHSIIHHQFADDIQLQMSAPHDKISKLLYSMQSCISDVIAWATKNMLKLNNIKI